MKNTERQALWDERNNKAMLLISLSVKGQKPIHTLETGNCFKYVERIKRSTSGNRLTEQVISATEVALDEISTEGES